MRTPVLLGLVLLAASPAAADTPLPAGIPDLAGPRALALAGGVGIAASNEGLFLNPAAVGARKRYSVEGLMMVDRRGADTTAQLVGGSIVDSLSSPVAGGVSYLRATNGDWTGNLWHLSISGAIAQDFHVGVAGKWFGLSGPGGGGATSAASVDAGIFWQVADLLSIGAAGYNLVPIANAAVAPMGAGAGIGIGNDRSYQLTADWRADFDRAGKTTNRYGVGLEALALNLIPLRAGWSKDDMLGTRWWSVGAGLVTQAGVALDVGYRQSLDDSAARTIAASLKVFLFQ